jgi:hypothetical protein
MGHPHLLRRALRPRSRPRYPRVLVPPVPSGHQRPSACPATCMQPGGRGAGNLGLSTLRYESGRPRAVGQRRWPRTPASRSVTSRLVFRCQRRGHRYAARPRSRECRQPAPPDAEDPPPSGSNRTPRRIPHRDGRPEAPGEAHPPFGVEVLREALAARPVDGGIRRGSDAKRPCHRRRLRRAVREARPGWWRTRVRRPGARPPSKTRPAALPRLAPCHCQMMRLVMCAQRE